MADSTVSRLAESIFSNTKIVDSYLKAKRLPNPSFDVDGPTFIDVGPEDDYVEKARVGALEAAAELFDLLQGPMALLRPVTTGASLQAISRWELATKVPTDGEVSFSELARLCDVNVVDMRRVLRYAIAFHRLFCEPKPGFVAHSLASRKLVEEPLLRDGLWLLGDLSFGAGTHTVEALEKFKDQEPNHTALSLMSGMDKGTYEMMEANPEFAARFARAMTSFAKFPNRSARLPRVDFAPSEVWSSLGKATVVDVGGSRGTDAIVLAGRYPDLRFIVQDLPKMIVGAEAAVPPELQSRIKFIPYSFFTPQTVVADAYLIKQCFHNWPDHYCVRIIKNFVSVMKPGAKIIVIDSLVPEPGTMSLMAERMVRAFDMLMLTQTNGREREAADWIELFKQADPRFKMKSMQPLATAVDFGPTTGLIEVIWEA